MKKILIIIILTGCAIPIAAQRVLTIDSCLALALRNNRQLNISKLNKTMATNVRKSVRTQYLPKVDAMGSYQFTSREVSILSNEQKGALSNLGTSLGGSFNSNLPNILTNLVQKGVMTPDQASNFGTIVGEFAPQVTSSLNETGQKLRDAFRTDTRNIFVASVFIRQPIYMGGAITAANRIADISEQIAKNDINAKEQSTIYDIENAYWTVISLRQKQVLADSYLNLVRKLNGDVAKMIKQGVATRADGLKVGVKVNEAEMTKTQVDDGVTLAKMYLCQLCGIPISDGITLADEDTDNLGAMPAIDNANIETAMDNRPELKMLSNAVEISKQNTKLARSAYLPQVAAVGGYTMSNPNVFNGFERKFGGYFNIGVMVHVPIWNWFEGKYKVNATKAVTCVAQLELSDTREKVELQVSQSVFKAKEASKKLIAATKNTEQANENLRCANLGFKEGVMQSTDVMEAQTAWLQAQSQKIDAQIDVKLSQVNLEKALGTLQY